MSGVNALGADAGGPSRWGVVAATLLAAAGIARGFNKRAGKRMRGFFGEAVAWARWWLRAGDYLVEIRDDQKPLQEKRWEKLETSYYDIPKGVWDALSEGDDAAGQSIEQAAGSWREQAKAQRDSGQPLVPSAPASPQ